MTRLTSRDKQILWSCGVCQTLTTSQVQRWHFRDVSANMVQKRIRKLVGAGYLRAIETRVCTENLVLLGKEGEKYLRQTGWKAELKNEAPKDLEHHLGVVDIRIAIDRGLGNLSGMKIRYFYAYWELGRFQWSYPVIPDAIFSLRNAHTLQTAVEFDRKTEMVEVFAKKLLQYGRLIRTHPLSTVMVVAEEDADVERLVAGLEGVRNAIPVLVVALPRLKKDGFAAEAQPWSRLHGHRTVAEQLEIDAAKIQDTTR